MEQMGRITVKVLLCAHLSQDAGFLVIHLLEANLVDLTPLD